MIAKIPEPSVHMTQLLRRVRSFKNRIREMQTNSSSECSKVMVRVINIICFKRVEK
jgi:hypothetical protein